MKNISRILGIVLALVIVAMGFTVYNSASSVQTGFYFGTTYASNYSFGADFYTEMYSVTYKALQQLNELAESLDSGFEAVLRALKLLIQGIGMLTMGIGVGVGAYFAFGAARPAAQQDKVAAPVQETPAAAPAEQPEATEVQEDVPSTEAEESAEEETVNA